MDAKYKNPRNLCSGSVRQLNNEITARRKVQFFAFALVRAEGIDFENSRMKQFLWLADQGFDVVEHRGSHCRDDGFCSRLILRRKFEHNDIPSDGLVLTYEDIAYGQSLGTDSQISKGFLSPLNGRMKSGRPPLLEIEWSPSRTGLINPVAVFEPVELEGTTVSRASVHNLSILKGLELGIGDKIRVYKANMIIPQIAENLNPQRQSGDSPKSARCAAGQTADSGGKRCRNLGTVPIRNVRQRRSNRSPCSSVGTP